MSNLVNLGIKDSVGWKELPTELQRYILKDLTDAQVAKVALCSKRVLTESDRKEVIFQRGVVTERELKSLIKRNQKFSFEKQVTLNLSFSQCTEKEFSDYISRFVNLTGINLSLKDPELEHSFVDGKSYLVNSRKKWLDKLNDLKVINLSNNSVSNKDLIKLIGRCPNVEKLVLNGCPKIKGTFYIKGMAKVKVLSFSKTSVDGLKLEPSVQENFAKNLEELHFGSINFTENISWIAKCVKLTSLTIGSSKEQSDVEPLSALTKLRRLNIFNLSGVVNSASLKNLTNLESISWPRHARRIAPFLPYWKNLKEISSFLPCEEIAKIENIEIVRMGKCSISELSHFKNLTFLKQLEINSDYNCLSQDDVFKLLPQLEVLRIVTRNEHDENSWNAKLIELKNEMMPPSQSIFVKIYHNPKTNQAIAQKKEEKSNCTIS